jgi:type IV secretion system protein VirB1
MILSLDQMQDLAARCAPAVAAETLLSVAKVESGFDPLAIAVNGKPVVRVRASDNADAVTKASALIAQGRTVDLGVSQINSRNLAWLGLTIEAAFDPCSNLAASADVLQEGFRRSAMRGDVGQAALLKALSYYNTGHPERGFRNGYVSKVTKAAAVIVPALRVDGARAVEGTAASDEAPPRRWEVFASTRAAPSFVIQLSPVQTLGGQE